MTGVENSMFFIAQTLWQAPVAGCDKICNDSKHKILKIIER